MEPSTIKDNFNKFYAFVRPYRTRALLAILSNVPLGWFDPIIAAVLKFYFDGILSGKTGQSPWFFPILILVCALFQSLFSYFSNYLNTWTGRKIANDVKLALFDKMMHSDTAKFDRTSSGEIMLRYNSDADLASDGLLGNIKFFVTRTVSSVCLVIVLFWNSWILAAVAVAAIVVVVIPLSRVRKRMKQIIRDSVATGTSVTTHYNEAYGGNRVVTSYNLYDQQSSRLRATLARLFHLSIKMTQRASFLSLALHFATAVGIAATIWLQSYLIATDRLTPGNFVSFMSALLMLYTPIKGLSNNFGSIQMSFMAMGRVLEALDGKPDIANRPNAIAVTTVSKSIRYEGVHFSYDASRQILSDVNLEIGVGKSFAFVGNSGGGKTTLVNLLPRFYDVTAGAVTIDGRDVRDIDLTALRNLIAIVFQDNFLFGGSIRENIMLAKPEAGEGELAQAVKAACLDEFIHSLPNGLDTVIGERGVTLSGGQKQRVAIARAFIKDAPIVILDEATSALDNKSEIVVQQAIENLMRNKTVLIIAHRLSTVINADRIVVLNEGRIVEEGTHPELVARDGIYASLYRTQLV